MVQQDSGGFREDERSLLAGCLAGDSSAWDRLCRTYAESVRSGAREGLRRSIGGAQADDVEEVVQIVLSSLVVDGMRRLRSFKGLSSLTTWLSVLAFRTAFNYARRARREAPSSPLLRWGEDSGDVSPDDLEPLLGNLPASHKVALRLYFVERMNRAEIADVLGMSQNSISSLLARAINRLRERVTR